MDLNLIKLLDIDWRFLYQNFITVGQVVWISREFEVKADISPLSGFCGVPKNWLIRFSRRIWELSSPVLFFSQEEGDRINANAMDVEAECRIKYATKCDTLYTECNDVFATQCPLNLTLNLIFSVWIYYLYCASPNVTTNVLLYVAVNVTKMISFRQ